MPGAARIRPALATAGLLAGALACTTGDVATPAPTPADVGGDSAGEVRATPTWFRDVEPIVQVECTGCHTTNGTGGFVLDQLVTTSLASIVAQRVSERLMPPWPPGPAGAPIAGARTLDDRAVATIVAWEAAGSPAGDPNDHVARTPRGSVVPARPADLHLEPAGTAYVEPPSPFVTDEIRCFVLELPAASKGAWITAARWRAGIPVGVHSLGGVVVDAASAARARARAGQDGRAGFECGGGLGEVTRGVSLGATGTGGANDGASALPAGAGVRVPVGGAVVMRVHYAVKHLALASDRSGVDLWLADDATRPALRPLVLASVAAPVEVPCPSGPSSDPSQPCSRDNAFARLAGNDAAAERARADALLTTCGTSLAQAARGSRLEPGGDEHFVVSSSCASVVPVDGTIRVVEARQQTHGASVRVEAERSDGSWSTVLDIPRWRWAWEASYVLAQGVPVAAGRRLRVSCTFDNGTANQWSALTGEAGHDAVARPPLLAPAYLIAAPHRAAEACTAHVAVERSPYRNAAWSTRCHEAQAVVDDVCGAGTFGPASSECAGGDDDRAVAVLGASVAELRAAHCPGTAASPTR